MAPPHQSQRHRQVQGAAGDDITLQLNRLGTAGGEALPAGVALTLAQPTGGAGAPDLAAALAAVGDEPFEFIIHPFTDAASLNALRDWMNDTAGRWSWVKQLYGHCYAAKRGTLGDLVAFGSARNDPHHTVHGFEPQVPQPAWEVAAAYGARTAVFISADPARPTQTGVLTGIDAAPAGQRFMLDERQTLLTSGVATAYVEGGEYRIERAITTYQKNAFGAEDDSYLTAKPCTPVPMCCAPSRRASPASTPPQAGQRRYTLRPWAGHRHAGGHSR